MVSTAGGIVIAVVVLLVAAAVGWIVFTQLRARRLGVCRMLSSPPLPVPTFADRHPWISAALSSHYRLSFAVVVAQSLTLCCCL